MSFSGWLEEREEIIRLAASIPQEWIGRAAERSFAYEPVALTGAFTIGAGDNGQMRAVIRDGDGQAQLTISSPFVAGTGIPVSFNFFCGAGSFLVTDPAFLVAIQNAPWPKFFSINPDMRIDLFYSSTGIVSAPLPARLTYRYPQQILTG